MLIETIIKILNTKYPNQYLLWDYCSRFSNTPFQTKRPIGRGGSANRWEEDVDWEGRWCDLWLPLHPVRITEGGRRINRGGLWRGSWGGERGKRIRKACLIERQDYWLTSPPVTVVTPRTVSANINSKFRKGLWIYLKDTVNCGNWK